ncbi:MAG TPA: prolyl oligopeptidase family serine peptidase [Pseudoxanthomonas sp.]|nr:prolyl oligopeptidase family serine peptidase [Pseudoxanthomonas sp.]
MKLPASCATLLFSCLLVLPLAGCSTMHAEEGGKFVKRTVLVEGVPRTYQIFVPAHRDANRPTPVVLFLHGSGERGSDGENQTNAGLGPYVRAHADDFPAIAVFPQVEENGEWMGANVDMALAATDAATKEFNGDPRRTYLTGLSMGGYGTWEIALKAPDRFAALVPICGAILPPNDERALYVTEVAGATDPYAALASRLKLVPTWIFHGALDKTVLPTDDRRIFAAFKAAGGNVQYTEFPDANHNSWDATYNHAPMWTWLFAQRKD